MADRSPAGRCAGLVLAAGAGRRLGSPKPPLVLAGERLVDRAVRVLREGGCDPVVVVLGAWVGAVPGALLRVNVGWESGLGSSLRVGLGAVTQLAGERRLAGADPEVGRVAIVPVDLPGLTPAAVERVVGAPGDLVAAAYGGRRGHPVVIAREHWAAVAGQAVGDRGARDFLDARDVVLVEVGDVASADDVDTPR